MNTQASKQARQLRLSRQIRQLYAVDQHGSRLLDDAGNQYLDLDRTPEVLVDLGVPPNLSAATLAGSKFKNLGEVRAWTQAMLDDTLDEHCAVIIGKGGNYTAAAILGNAVRRGLTVSWYTWHNFTRRYTERINHGRMLTSGNAEEASSAAEMITNAEDEDDYLSSVYDVLALIEFDINDVRDFAVPEICALIRQRTAFGRATVVTVPAANSDVMAENSQSFGARGSLLRLFEHEAKAFDGR